MPRIHFGALAAIPMLLLTACGNEQPAELSQYASCDELHSAVADMAKAELRFNGRPAADDTLSEQIAAAANALISSGAVAAGSSVTWQLGSDSYLFISDGNTAVSATDVLVKINSTSTTGLTISAGGDITSFV